MVMKYWKAGPTSGYLVEAQRDYAQALELAKRALSKAKPDGRWYPDFWVGRLEFAHAYSEAVEAVQQAATAEAANNGGECARQAEKALQTLSQGLEAYARVARNRTDLGAIAVVNEYGIRQLRAKIAELSK
jgi:hypothetical protein